MRTVSGISQLLNARQRSLTANKTSMKIRYIKSLVILFPNIMQFLLDLISFIGIFLFVWIGFFHFNLRNRCFFKFNSTILKFIKIR